MPAPAPTPSTAPASPARPTGAIPLAELRAMLLHPSSSYQARDAAIGHLVERAQAEGGRRTVGGADVLLPGLRRAIWPLFEACPTKLAELLCGTAPLHEGLHKGLRQGLHKGLRPGLEPSGRREVPAPGSAEGSSAPADSRGRRA
ncbi:MAG: hypothetical protein ACRDVW_04095 [Acidimicrobiales bacterium]